MRSSGRFNGAAAGERRKDDCHDVAKSFLGASMEPPLVSGGRDGEKFKKAWWRF